jgi:hypothetical protein
MVVSAASIEKKNPDRNERKHRPRKLNASAALSKRNFNHLGRIEAKPLGIIYKDSVQSGSESDSDSSENSSDSDYGTGTETETDVKIPKHKIADDHYYSSTDDLYNLADHCAAADKQFFYEK